MLLDEIKTLDDQLDYEPVIENAGSWAGNVTPTYGGYVVAGMGGSNLAAGIIKSWKPKLDIIIHRDYGLPDVLDISGRGIVASSYSGNTEETIDAFNEAVSGKLPLVAITTGGVLLESAKKDDFPYIQIPEVSGGPRFAIGYSIKATLKALGEEAAVKEISGLANSLNIEEYENKGVELSEKLRGKIPIIYSSGNNSGLARYWKISFNETAKLPAFYNFIPELNHNEMTGFGSKIFDGKLNGNFALVFINDQNDQPIIRKRMAVTRKIFEDKGFTVLDINLDESSFWHKSFACMLMAISTTLHLADFYGEDPLDASMVEEFKGMVK